MRASVVFTICSALACSQGAAVEAGLPVLSASAQAAARAEGHSLFLRNCSLCHGEEADGHGMRASGFERPPADLHRPEFHGAQGEARVLQALRHGLPGTPMPGWKDALTDPELRALAAYVTQLEEAPDVPGLWMR